MRTPRRSLKLIWFKLSSQRHRVLDRAKASPQQRLDNCHTQKYMSRIWSPTGNQRERSLNLGNDNPSYALLLPNTTRGNMFLPCSTWNLAPHTHTHSFLHPFWTTVVLTPLLSCWAGGRKLVKWHPPGASRNTPKPPAADDRQARHAGWRLSHSADWLTDWQTCFEWLQNTFSCDPPLHPVSRRHYFRQFFVCKRAQRVEQVD